VSGAACFSAMKPSRSPRSFPPNPFPREMLSWGRFPVEADLEATLGIQKGAGVLGRWSSPCSHVDGVGGGLPS